MTTGSSAHRACAEADRAVAPIRPDGLSEGTVAEIRGCLEGFPKLRWVKLYGSRATGRHRRGKEAQSRLAQERAIGSGHHAKNLTHDQHHLIELGFTELPHGMRAGTTHAPVEGFDLLAKHIAVGVRPIDHGAEIHGKG
jgi:hypothetical protein